MQIELREQGQIDPMTELFDAIKSPVTKRKYELRMRQFLAWVFGDKKAIIPTPKGRRLDEKEEQERVSATRKMARDFVSRAKREPDWATRTVDDFLREIKNRVEAGEITAGTVSIYTKPIKLFCVMNDLTMINWPKLSKKMPKAQHAGDDRTPTLSEVRKILQYPDRRIKPIVLVMISSGIRVGSWQSRYHGYMKWGHIEKIEKKGVLVAARLHAYNTKSKRWYLSDTYISPEAYRAVEDYINYRKNMGETITDESPVIRDLIDTDRGGKGRAMKPKAFTSDLIKRLIEKAIASAGIRPEKLPEGKRRYEFKATHGFRKFFDTVGERHMKTLHVEQLEDHDTGLKESYNRPSQDDLLEDYLKAVPDLTILEQAPRLVSEDFTELKLRVAELEKRQKAYEVFTKKFLNATPKQLAKLGETILKDNVREA